ncbi:pyridoxamine 5'-phosphate oxidase family protein [Mucilaginibacter sp. FT3.2]|uniref:pyridoxamine 5'-phosphate oxidase family protein n=1 Tax=Mucilaginibacter sp. FT3.2 TaxID=2723090 RepID=UPI00160C52DB|nr:pyridoxamine 5'-phosphate oxidase family protein [Mucilaginibacter sp. FT3.2]MBB6235133.1 hypothetical protein [Mucilaginibacter sp. FT3.2]
MLGELKDTEIEDLLKNQFVGRIGCHAEGVTYIVPVNYLYDGNNLLAHSAKGMKIDMMRKNPEICFEVDHIQNMNNWQCVIAWGTFEEIRDIHEKGEAMQKLLDRIMPVMDDETANPSHGFTANASDVGPELELIIYKITLSKKTGRFEKK